MKLKKFALRGMIILAVIIALCVLFSGTLRSLTTAKVKRADVKNGKFENVIELNAKVAFPEKEEIKIKVPDGLSLTVQRVPVAAGQKVKAGETLVQTKFTDMEKELAALEKKYDEARSTIEDWDRKHSDIRLTRNEEAWVDAYDAVRNASKEELTLRQSLMAVLDIADVADLIDDNVKAALKKMSQKEGQPILDDYRSWGKKKEELAEAQKKLKSLDRYAVSDDVWATLKSRRDAQDSLKDAEDQMMQIRKIEKQMSDIKAPYDGYVVELKVRKGDSLVGDVEVIVMTAEGKKPVLRAETDPKKPVQKGAVVTVPVKNYWSPVQTKIIDTGINDEGKSYADAEINGDVTDALGNVSSMMRKDDIKLKITSRAKDSTCLIDTGAVYDVDSDNPYVYMIEQSESPLGGVRMTVKKQSVTILNKSEKKVSIQEDLTYRDIAYMPDRPIEDGDTVMWY